MMDQNTKIYPLLIVISGPSGVGKDSVIEEMKQRNTPFHFVVTTTTRKPRLTDRPGIDYNFVSIEEFQCMIENDEMLEHALVYTDYKGVPKIQIRQAFASGKDVIMRVDVQGAATIRQKHPNAILIFLTGKDEDELIKRLKRRKTETSKELEVRLIKMRDEVARIPEFDYVVSNCEGKLKETVDVILCIIQAEHHRVQHQEISL